MPRVEHPNLAFPLSGERMDEWLNWAELPRNQVTVTRILPDRVEIDVVNLNEEGRKYLEPGTNNLSVTTHVYPWRPVWQPLPS